MSDHHVALGLRSDDFRAGVAYAAHLLRHAVGDAHGGDIPGPSLSVIEPRRCCQAAVASMAIGMAEGLEEAAGQTAAPHDHRAGEPG